MGAGFWVSLTAAMLAAPSGRSEPLKLGMPMGAAWTTVYGLPPAKPDIFVPHARAIGAKFTRLTLYWSQLEPAQGARRWDELDAYLAQPGPSDEAFLTLASSSPWATQVSGWVFPSSPAKDPKAHFESRGRRRIAPSDSATPAALTIGFVTFIAGSLFQCVFAFAQRSWHLPWPAALAVLQLCIVVVIAMLWLGRADNWGRPQRRATILAGYGVYLWAGFVVTQRLYGRAALPGHALIAILFCIPLLAAWRRRVPGPAPSQ